MLTVKNFTQMYGKFKAVDNISFNVSEGAIMGLIGTNGAGKTTIIKAACGLVKPTEGEFSISEMNIRSNRKEYIRNIGAVLEGNRNIYMRLSPEENIEYFARLRNLRRHEFLPRLNELLKIKEKQSAAAFQEVCSKRLLFVAALSITQRLLF